MAVAYLSVSSRQSGAHHVQHDCPVVFRPGCRRTFRPLALPAVLPVLRRGCSPVFLPAGVHGIFDPEWRFIPMVGASGSIYGIMAACAVLFPHARVQLLFPPVNLSVRQFALAVLGVAAAVIIFQWNNAGGEAGHLGGMFAGFILTLLILWKEKLSSPKRKAASSSHYSPEPSSRRPAQAYPSEKEVDEIMEKYPGPACPA